MFRTKTAWFSSSVKRGIRSFWVCEGGVIVSKWRIADYLFSDDATCPDTNRIFESADYAEDRVTVFQCAFLSACETRQSAKSVSIGHYVLPPISIQEEVKAVVGRFIWEQEEGLAAGEGSYNRHILRAEPVKGDCHNDARGHTEQVKHCQEDSMMATPQREGSLCCEVQHYPVNNMVSGYVCIEQLKKYSGELHDFLPGHFGYSVSRAHEKKYCL